MPNSAIISPCGKYRYELRRVWDESLPLVLFVCLNPSTADSQQDDQTFRVCIRYAKSWGYGGLLIANLFAYRDPDSSALQKTADPVGPENDDWLQKLQSEADLVICAWGNNGAYKNRDQEVLSFIKAPHCLVKLKSGRPGHPLFKRKDLKPTPL